MMSLYISSDIDTPFISQKNSRTQPHCTILDVMEELMYEYRDRL